jgi:hypothetical protein
MKQSILNYIRKHPTATFANLDSDIPGFSGELAMFNPAFPNIILWPSMSAEAIEALGELLAEKAITMKRASQLSYFIDGKRPTLRVASAVKQYKTERWLPVCFSMNPHGTAARATA